MEGGAFYTYLPGTGEAFRLTLQGQAVDSSGYIGTSGIHGEDLVALSSLVGYPDNGYVAVHDGLGTTRAGVFVDGADDGHIRTWNHNDLPMVQITNTGYTATEDGGMVKLWGVNGERNVLMAHDIADGNHGIIEVYDEAGVAKAGIKVDAAGNGVVWGDQKSFAMANPNQPGTELWYSSLEGPEAAAYTRGTASLVNGTAVVYFPDYFASIVSPEGMTVQVTAHSADSRGLAVVERSQDRIVVRELYQGTGSYAFDYTVTAVRKGFEDYQVVHQVAERAVSAKSALEQKPVESRFRGDVKGTGQ